MASDATNRSQLLLRTEYGLDPSSPGGALLSQFLAAYLSARERTGTTESGDRVEAYAFREAARETLGARLDRVAQGAYAISLACTSLNPVHRTNLILHPALRQYQERQGRGAAEGLIRAFYDASVRMIGSGQERTGQGTLSEAERAGANDIVSRDWDLDMLVGNGEAIAELRRYRHRLLCYDPTSGTNPFVEAGLPLPRCLLLAGPPGTGKSTMVKGIFAEALRISEEQGLAPVQVTLLGNAAKTRYQNDGLQALETVVRRTGERESIHLTLIDDIDMVVFPRTERTSEDELRYQHALLQWLDPGGTARRGNELNVSTSNKSKMLDPAVYSRVSERVIEVLGPTRPAEYAELFRRRLAGLERHRLLRIGSYDGIGAAAAERALSGRAVTHLCSRLTDAATREILFDDERFDYSAAEIVETVARNAAAVDETTVLQGIGEWREAEDYC